MLKHSLLLASILTLFLLHGCSSDTASETQNMVATNDYTLADTQGNSYTVHKEGDLFTLAGHENKVVIYDIFATWCPPCRATAPHLSSLQKKYPDEILVLGVSIEDDIDAAGINTFKDENDAGYRITFGEQSINLSRIIASSIHVGQQFPIPLMVMYKNGKYITHYVGLVPEEMIESDIQLALGKK